MSLTNQMQRVMPLTIYTVLKGEHDEVKGLFKLLEASPSSLGSGRAVIFDRLRRELLSHLIAEEGMVYEAIRDWVDDVALIDASEREHQEIERLLNSVWRLDPDTDEWRLQLETLEERFDTHAKKEEHELFEKMKEYLSDEEARNMAEEFHVAKNAELEVLKETA